jgi:L-aspartate oxidase
MLPSEQRIHADVLVVGSGLAGLLLSLKLADNKEISLVVASKGWLSDSNSTFAQGGLAAVTETNAFDSPETHLIDTIKSGAGAADISSVQGIVFGGKRLVTELADLGVSFDRKPEGGFELALEGGHSQARVLHNKDATGKAITTALAERLRELAAAQDNIRIMENTYAIELLVENECCIGARLESGSNRLAIIAPHTVLATGGVGQIFQRTTNPEVATGDGIALAYASGAKLIDMEYMQFHPTALCKEGAPAFLISEAVRGAGATLTDHDGKRFVQRFHHDGELATRDIVARAIHTVIHEHGLSHVNLDMRPIGSRQITSHFPTIQKRCAEFGIDILREPIPVSPAAHYFMGGISADIDGNTSVPGLYAIGECACTGLHGANRLASNSLLEAGVMALRLADALLSPRHTLATSGHSPIQVLNHIPYVVPGDISAFRHQMFRYAGLVRSEAGLSILLRESYQNATQLRDMAEVENMRKRERTEANMLSVGRLIAQAALLRCESRGSHYRDDFPTTDNERFGRRLWLSKNGYGWTMPTTAVEKDLGALIARTA